MRASYPHLSAPPCTFHGQVRSKATKLTMPEGECWPKRHGFASDPNRREVAEFLEQLMAESCTHIVSVAQAGDYGGMGKLRRRMNGDTCSDRELP